jgi:phage tail protein X
MAVRRYVTQAGDRWDLLAHRFYGDAYAFGALVEANPEVTPSPVLSGGLSLVVPELPRAPETVMGAPPWKR